MSSPLFHRLAYSPFLNRARLTGGRLLDQMTDDLRLIAANAGMVGADDLELLGWPPDQIAATGAAARRRALRARGREGSMTDEQDFTFTAADGLRHGELGATINRVPQATRRALVGAYLAPLERQRGRRETWRAVNGEQFLT